MSGELRALVKVGGGQGRSAGKQSTSSRPPVRSTYRDRSEKGHEGAGRG